MPASTKSEQTTLRLLDAAAAEFMEHGYEAARVSSIARRVGLTVGAVYARWPHKSDVVVAALDHIFHQILPDRRIKEWVEGEARSSDMMALLGESLLSLDESRDVMVHVFGSARNNGEVRDCLQGFLNEEARQLSYLIEEGKEAGLCDPAFSTAAMALMCQAIGIGTHLVLSAGLDDDLIPSQEEWSVLLRNLISSVGSDPASP